MKSSAFKSSTPLRSALGLVLVALSIAEAAPFVPKDPEQVLERLRSTPFDAAARQLRHWRADLAAAPDNLAVAEKYVRACIERSRAEADPRYLGRAQAALAPWWETPQPPAEVLVLRATIKQSLHQFLPALADLELARRMAPTDAQAWLTRATILTVLGRYAEARRACLPLVRLAPQLPALTAAANVASLNGEAESSRELLARVLGHDTSATIAEKQWALTVLAETSARLGQARRAEQSFREALALGQHDVYLLGAYADFLLDQGQNEDVLALLKSETRADGLLLRLTLAEARVVPRPAAFVAHLGALADRFEAARLRGDGVHQREEARFALHLLHRPPEALRLAQANWQVQHEPADARILLEAALAARDVAAARPVLDFLKETRLEDYQLARLANALAGEPSK